MSVRVHCINKSGGYHENPHEAILYLGWINESTSAAGKSSRLEMYNFIITQQGKAYVKDAYGNVAYLYGTVSRTGNPYVQTYADGKWSDNLLSLPECACSQT